MAGVREPMGCGYIGGPVSNPMGNGAENRDDMGGTEGRSPRKKKIVTH